MTCQVDCGAIVYPLRAEHQRLAPQVAASSPTLLAVSPSLKDQTRQN